MHWQLPLLTVGGSRHLFFFSVWSGGNYLGLLHFIYCMSSIPGMDVFLFLISFWSFASSFMLCCAPGVGWVRRSLMICLFLHGRVLHACSKHVPRLYLGGFSLRWYMLCCRGSLALGCVSFGYRLLLDLKVYGAGGLDLFLSSSLDYRSRVFGVS